MPDNEFEKASREQSVGVVREFFQFLGENKKWWLLPIVIVLVICTLLVVVAGTFLPHIYALW